MVFNLLRHFIDFQPFGQITKFPWIGTGTNLTRQIDPHHPYVVRKAHFTVFVFWISGQGGMVQEMRLKMGAREGEGVGFSIVRNITISTSIFFHML